MGDERSLKHVFTACSTTRLVLVPGLYHSWTTSYYLHIQTSKSETGECNITCNCNNRSSYNLPISIARSMPTAQSRTRGHTHRFNCHFPGKCRLASFPLILSLHWCLSWESSWDRPKLSLFHVRTRTAYLYRCLEWYNGSITPRVHSGVTKPAQC